MRVLLDTHAVLWFMAIFGCLRLSYHESLVGSKSQAGLVTLVKPVEKYDAPAELTTVDIVVMNVT